MAETAPHDCPALGNPPISDTQYELALSSGIPIHQELALKPGQYRLGLGVSDITNHNLGTLDMPVKLVPTQTGVNHLRHAKFVALLDDKDPRKVVREA